MTNNHYERIFQVSSELFWGYRMLIDISKFDEIQSIINYVKCDIRTFLLSRNLISLVEKLESSRFHIHSPYDNYDDLLNRTNEKEVIFICDHCS
jgi:hypothetical protein